jgi:TP901 family phage tail tape measure protein
MASGRKVAEVFVEVRANLSKLKSGMKSAMSIASGGASVIGKVLGGLASVIKNVLTAAFKVVGAVIKTIFNLVSALFSSIIKWAKRGVLALSAFVALSIVVGAKFGQSMARVKALTGASTKEFKALREEARRLGRATEYSANQAADAMSIFAMAGFKTNDVITAMAPTLDFAAASGLDLASAADIAARVMGGMQLEAKDLEHTMDVLTKAFTSANMDATDLGEAMKFVGAVGKTVGKDVEELVGALTALAAAGNRGSMAGTGLRKVLMGLATSKIQKRLAKLGVSVTDTAGAMKPISKIVGDIGRATKNLSDMEIADLGVQMFGARGGVAFLQLVGQGEAAIEAYTTQLANVDGFTKKIAATQRDTLATAFKIVQSAIADVMITITDIMEPTLLGAADTQVKMWNKIGAVLEENKTRIQNFIKNTITWVKTKLPEAIHIAIGAVSLLWDEFSQTFNNIKELVLDVTKSAGSAFTDFLRYDETTGSGIERALTSIVIGLVRVGQEIRNVFEDMKVGLTDIAVKAQGGAVKWIGEVGEQIVPDWAGGTWFKKAKLAGSVLGGGVTMDKESRAAKDKAEVDSILASMNTRFEERETMKDAKETGKEFGEAAVAKLKEWVVPKEEAWRTALYQGSDKRAKQSELVKLKDDIKELNSLFQVTRGEDGEIKLSDKGMETIERKVSRQGFPIDRTKEEAKRFDELINKMADMVGRRLELEGELGLTSAKKQWKSFQQGTEKEKVKEKGKGRMIDPSLAMPSQKVVSSFLTSIQTATGTYKMAMRGEVDHAKDTADNTAEMLGIMKETKEPIKNNEKYNLSTSVQSKKTADNTEANLR